MAETENEGREPDSVEETSTSNAGPATEPSEEEAVVDTPLPDFEQMNENLKETRKQSGPVFDESESPASPLDTERGDDIDPSDPS